MKSHSCVLVRCAIAQCGFSGERSYAFQDVHGKLWEEVAPVEYLLQEERVPWPTDMPTKGTRAPGYVRAVYLGCAGPTARVSVPVMQATDTVLIKRELIEFSMKAVPIFEPVSWEEPAACE